uniref:hypothetical protein n=2 Tax=Photobacterium leiognathi TaxID=553611 RepID=UPI003B968446
MLLILEVKVCYLFDYNKNKYNRIVTINFFLSLRLVMLNKTVLSLIACIFPLCVNAAEKIHKDWIIGTEGDEYYYSATVNKSDHIFGKYCYFESENCIYLTAVDITCTKGNKYPVLVNTDTGAFHVSLMCGDSNVLIFDEFDSINEAATKGKQLGISIPMESGLFKVTRFSLSGSTYSIETMTKEAFKRIQADSPDSQLL